MGITDNGLSKVARKVLSHLEMRSRDSFASIARATKISEQLVKYHVQKAKEEGLIGELSAVFDPSAFGCTMYIIYLRFLGASTADEQRWFEKCSRLSEVMVVASTFGKWNGFVAVWSKNQEALESRIATITSSMAGKVAEMQVTTRLHCHYGSMQILNNTPQVIIHTSSIPDDPNRYDEKDLGILRCLASNSRVSAAAIGEMVSLSPTAVQGRIQKLEEKKAIIAYRALYRYDKLGYTQFRILLRLVDPSGSNWKKIAKELFDTGHAFIVSRHLGFSDLDARCYAKSLQHLAIMISRIRDKFVNDILQVEIVPFLSIRYLNQLPVN